MKEQRFDFWGRSACVSPDGKQAALLHDGVTLVTLPQLDVLASTSEGSWRGVSRCATFAPNGDCRQVQWGSARAC